MSTFHALSVSSLSCLARPRAAAAAIALGLTAGLATGDNLTVCLLLLAAAVLRVPAIGFVVAWATGLWIGWLALPLSFVVGQWLLDELEVGSMLATLLGPTAMAMLGWDRYTIAGGLLMAPLLAVPLAALLAAHQRHFAARPRLAIAPPEQMLATLPRSARVLAWLAGTRLLPASEITAVPDERLLRHRWGAWLAVGLAATVGVACTLPDKIHREALVGHLVALLGAPVTVDEVDFSASSGQLHLVGLCVHDPAQPERQVARVQQASAKLGEGSSLIEGQLKLERVLLHDLRLAPSASTAPRILPEFATALHEGTAASTSGTIELPCDGCFAGGAAAIERLGGARQALAALQDILDRRSWAASPHIAPSSPRGTLRAARSRLGFGAPQATVDYLQIEELPVCWNLGRGAIVKLLGVGATDTDADQGPTIELTAPELCLELSAQLNCAPQGQHSLQMRVYDSIAADWLDSHRHVRLQVTSGTVSSTARGSFGTQGFELETETTVRGLCAQWAGDEPVAGLSVATWNRALARLPEMLITSRLSGDWQRARLTFDPASLIDRLAAALRHAGEDELALAVMTEYRGGPAMAGEPAPVVAAAPQRLPVEGQAGEPTVPVEPAASPVPRTPASQPGPPAEYLAARPTHIPVDDRYGTTSLPAPHLASEAVAAESPTAPSPSLPITVGEEPHAAPPASVVAPEAVASAQAATEPSVVAGPPSPTHVAEGPAEPAPVALQPEPAMEDTLHNPLRGAAPHGGLRRRGVTPRPAPPAATWHAESEVVPATRVPSPSAPSQPAALAPQPLATSAPASPNTPITIAPPQREPVAEPQAPVAPQEVTPPAVAAHAVPPIAAPLPAPQPIDMELGYDENFPTAAAGGVAPVTIAPEAAAIAPYAVGGPSMLTVPSAPQVARAVVEPDTTSPDYEERKLGFWQRVRTIFRVTPADEPPATNPFTEPERVAERPMVDKPEKEGLGRFFRR